MHATRKYYTRLLVTANVVPSSPILVTMMIDVLSFSETWVLTRTARRNIPEDDILHSPRRENLKYFIALTGWALSRRRNVSPVRYELGFYILEDYILHSHRRGNLKSYRGCTCYCFKIDFFLTLFSEPENGGDMFLRNGCEQ
jgi:hypothetical protein